MSGLLSTREAVRIELARSAVVTDGALEQALTQALHLSAGALGVVRVSIWFVEDDWRSIRSRMSFDVRTMRLSSGETIDLTQCPNYAEALRSRRTVVANDARTNPATCELQNYLVANNIGAMIDSPIFHQGKLIGIVCYEHLGSTREWTRQDMDFVSTMSDMISLYLEQAETQRATAALLEARTELEKARVMDSLGRLAAGVAHDFNNILGAVSLKVELHERKLPGDATADLAKDVRSLVDQGARLVHQLLTFARAEKTAPVLLDFVAVARDMEPLLRTVARGEIDLSMTLPDDPLMVRVERSRAEQVLLNLTVNARDALLGGGSLAVGVARGVESDVVLTIEDTGVGMDEAVRERIFEPFFTTKKSGKGTGLGLATVYGIVTDAGGHIDVTTAIGEGTTFRVHFPLVDS